MTSIQGKLTGACVRAVYLFASTEQTRYYLCGVHVAPHPEGGALITATNGHAALRVWDKDAVWHWEGAIIQLDKSVLTKLKSTKGAARALIVEGAPDLRKFTRACVAHADVDVRLCDLLEESESPVHVGIVDGSFPDVDRVFPKSDATMAQTFGFDADYVARFGEAASELRGGKRNAQIALGPCDGSSPCLVYANGVEHMIGILMPVRNTREMTRAPLWARPSVAKQKAA